MRVVYACGSPVRQEACKALAEGSKSKFESCGEPIYQGGEALVWGLIRGAPRVISECKKAKENYYQIDNGYIGRNKFYRVTKNAFQLTEIKERPDDRWKRLVEKYKINLSPWTRGSHVVFALSTPHLYKFLGLDYDTYVKTTLEILKKHTSRKIVVRPKEATVPIEHDLKGAWALVTHTSATGLDALKMGVPVFTTGPCAAKPLALQDLTKIESPIYPEREPLFRSLAYGQFTTDEMRSGLAWQCLESS